MKRLGEWGGHRQCFAEQRGASIEDQMEAVEGVSMKEAPPKKMELGAPHRELAFLQRVGGTTGRALRRQPVVGTPW